MKIAVTAASGRLGSAVVNALSNEIGNENVIALARTPGKAWSLGVEVRPGDYANRTDLEDSLKGVEAVLLVSGMDAPEKRIEQHRNVISAARKNGVRKIVYTSIVGKTGGTSFSPIIESNRQTESDVQNSGLDWVIGRNGLYIEPDLEYIENYKKTGKIVNCAADGKCAYTSRDELGYAYAKMLTEDKHNGNIYSLVGEPITQAQLAGLINEVYGTELSFESISVDEYRAERVAELGDFLGTVISGIYQGIRDGSFNPLSDYEKAAGRKHKSALEMIREFKAVH